MYIVLAMTFVICWKLYYLFIYLPIYLFITVTCIYKVYIIKYFSQYTQPSVGLICHFIHYKETKCDFFITQTKVKLQEHNTNFLNLIYL